MSQGVKAASQKASDTNDKPREKFYFFAWRWHFYAGLFVLPFLVMLALSGLVMMYDKPIQNFIYSDSLNVTPVAQAEPLPTSQLIQNIQAKYPDATITEWIPAQDTDKAELFSIRQNLATGSEDFFVAVNPYSGEVQGDFSRTHSLLNWLTELHGTLMIGDIGDRLIEIAASLAIILIATGVYLWLPKLSRGAQSRAASSGFLKIRTDKGKRVFYRDLHANIGGLSSVFLLGFLLTGLAWAGVWGGKIVQPWATYPDGKYYNMPESNAQTATAMQHDQHHEHGLTHQDLNHGAEKHIAWNLEQAPLPQSDPSSEAAQVIQSENHQAKEENQAKEAIQITEDKPHHGSAASGHYQVSSMQVDKAIAQAKILGMQDFRLMLPQSETGVFSFVADAISADIHDPRDERILHLDQYSLTVLDDIAWQDYTGVAKLVSASVALHKGSLGGLNLFVNTILCIGLIILPLSGALMWWKRRPSKGMGLAAPKIPEVYQDVNLWRVGIAILVVLAIAFPLAGGMIIVSLLLDYLIISRSGKLTKLFN